MNQVTYLSRDVWGGGPLRSGHLVPLQQFVGIVVHHTVIVMPDYDHDGMVDGDLDDVIRYMQQLQHARPDLGDEVPYSFVGFRGAQPGDVIVAEGRGFGVTGAHTIGYNSTRYGYAFAGDFTNTAPTSGMWDGVTWIGAQLHDPVDAVPTLEHRDVYATQCPGNSTPGTAPSQPPFIIHVDPDPQPNPGVTPVYMTFMLREHSSAVAAVFHSDDDIVADVRPVGSFADTKTVFVNHFGVKLKPPMVPTNIKDGHGAEEPVWIVGEDVANTIGLPR